MTYKTDLPVMLPVKPREPEPFLSLTPWHMLVIALLTIIGPSIAFAQSGSEAQSPLAVLMNWAPLLLKGFIFNLVISISAMALGTVVGAMLGLCQISLLAVTTRGS